MKHTPRFYLDFLLFLKQPKEFIYSFTYPKDKFVQIDKFNPRSREAGKLVQRQIASICPNAEVYFTGSAYFGLPGRLEADITAVCDSRYFADYVSLISRKFNQPYKTRKDFAQWELEVDGVSIDITLYMNTNQLGIKTLKTFFALQNSALLKEYRKLKLSANNLSVREYARAKLRFFSDYGL